MVVGLKCETVKRLKRLVDIEYIAEAVRFIRKMHFVPGISRDILGWLKVL